MAIVILFILEHIMEQSSFIVNDVFFRTLLYFLINGGLISGKINVVVLLN